MGRLLLTDVVYGKAVRSKEGGNVRENEYWERMIMLSSKVIKGRGKLEHLPSLLLLPSDVETVLLGATI